MQRKEDLCMAEMSSPREVSLILKYLNNISVFGCVLTMKPSKQSNLRDIYEPFDLPNGQPSYKDYSSSRNNRFVNLEYAAKNRILPPTSLLHWFNAPATMNEARMKKIFADKGVSVPKTVTIFNTRSERSSSGIMEFASVNQASEALIKVNHTTIPEVTAKAPYILKLSFGDDAANKIKTTAPGSPLIELG